MPAKSASRSWSRVYSIPKITLYPIVLLAFGIGMPAKVAFGAIHGIVPIAIFTMGALRNLNPVFSEDGARATDVAWQIAAASCFQPVPEIFTGFRIGFSLTLIGTLLGEMFASQRGLGYLLMQAIGLHNIRMITAVTFILVCVAVTASALLLAIDRRLRRHMFGIGEGRNPIADPKSCTERESVCAQQDDSPCGGRYQTIFSRRLRAASSRSRVPRSRPSAAITILRASPMGPVLRPADLENLDSETTT